MGSHGRPQSEARMVPVLDCQRCGELTPGSRFRYVCDRLVCDHCGAENSQMRVHSVQVRDIFVHFVTSGACSVQGMDLNLDRVLGPPMPVTSPDTLRRLLSYLGANRVALNEFDKCRREPWGRRRANNARARPQEPAATARVNRNIAPANANSGDHLL
jgi:hypothetical protein